MYHLKQKVTVIKLYAEELELGELLRYQVAPTLQR
jgi:hypothetical protein